MPTYPAEGTFTITAVSDAQRPWKSQQGGEMIGYRVDMQDAAGEVHQRVEWSRKATSAAPSQGQTVDGSIAENGNYGLKFKKASGGGGGGGGWGGGSRPEDPKRNARIVRQHSQSCALDLVRLALELGVVDKPADKAAFFALYRDVADWLDRDVSRAENGIAASTPQQTNTN